MNTLSPCRHSKSAIALYALIFGVLAACGEDGDSSTADAASADATAQTDGGTDGGGAAEDTAGSACPANTCAIAMADGVSCTSAGAALDACHVCTPSEDAKGWTLTADKPCDDGDACTTGDACDNDGKCGGGAMNCDDDNACTADSCAKGECLHNNTSDACDDGDACTGDGICVTGSCGPGLPIGCSDGDACTKDACDSKTGKCASKPDPNACDDGSACTTDSCDPKAGCSHVALAKGATCSDADACTHGEACSAAGTCGGGTASDCKDDNACTTDSCDSKIGCVYKFNGNSCSDGESCTVGDSCSGGVCLGQKTSACKLCKKTFGQTAAQLIGFAIGADGEQSNGLDVDDDPKTCAPKGKCSGGIDNAFAALAFAINPVLSNAVSSGALQFVADFDGFKGPNAFFNLHLYYANQTSASLASQCKPQTQPCSWAVSQQAFTAKCVPRVTFSDAKLVGTKLTAGGAGTLFAMEVSLAGGDATFLVKGARLEGQLQLASDGKTVLKFDGVIGGSMTEKAILSTFQGLPDDAFKPLTKPGAMALVKSLLVLDIDADGDGKPESTSVGLKVKAIGAKPLVMATN